jgi:hypothetical protein
VGGASGRCPNLYPSTRFESAQNSFTPPFLEKRVIHRCIIDKAKPLARQRIMPLTALTSWRKRADTRDIFNVFGIIEVRCQDTVRSIAEINFVYLAGEIDSHVGKSIYNHDAGDIDFRELRYLPYAASFGKGVDLVLTT